MSPSIQHVLQQAAARIATAERIVCLTGAGISAESGIATFRSAQSGLWTKYDPMQLASQEGFARNPSLVWRWYMQRLHQVEEARPNPGHLALARLETLAIQKSGQMSLITQNVDDLHERAGNHHVLHLHGQITHYRCNDCRRYYLLRLDDRQAEDPPWCATCGGQIRPDVVWFGEMLLEAVYRQAQQVVQECDLLLVVGTSGVVYPAAELPYIAQGNGACVIDVNPQDNAIGQIADIALRGTAGVILPKLLDNLLSTR